MRIPCPHCGTRSHEEFSYLGDATVRRPAAPPPGPGGADDPAVTATFCDYVYLRDNPAGPLQELWFHGMGCGAWIVLERDTRSHAILGSRAARDDGGHAA